MVNKEAKPQRKGHTWALARVILILAILGLLVLGLTSCSPSPTPTPTRTPAPIRALTPTLTFIPTPTPAPRQFTETIEVSPRKVVTWTMDMSPENRMEGSFTVGGGGGNRIDFSVKDPFGNTLLDVGRVFNERSFAFTASAAGGYQLVFGNTFDSFTNKEVSLTATVFYR